MVKMYVLDGWWYLVRWALREIVHGRDILWALGILWRSKPNVRLSEYAVEILIGPVLVYVQRKPLPRITLR